MKKTLLSLATLATAGLLSMAADCSGTNVTACTIDDDCAADQICVIADGETEGACENAECLENEDCALAAATTEFVCPFGKGGAACDVDFDACNPEGGVAVVDSLGTQYCGFSPSADFSCADADGVEAVVEADAGGTVTICVDAAGSCTDGQCG